MAIPYTLAAEATNDPAVERDLTLVLAPTGNGAATNLCLHCRKSIAGSLTSGQTDTVPSQTMDVNHV